MTFGLSGARDDRRRRVLTEEVTSTATGSTASGASSADGPRYAEAAALENQPRVTDLLPQRRTTILLALLGATSIVVALEYLHLGAAAAAESTAVGPPAALDLATPGALADWFSSIVLALAAATAVLIFSLRKHKIDDYRGRYRVWLWAAAGWIVLSASTTAPLHGAYVDLMTHLTGWTAGPHGAFWWIAPAAIVLGAIATGVLLDVRPCRMAFGSLALAHVAWGVGVIVHLGWLPAPAWATSTMTVAGAAMGGHLLLLTGLVLYARHVILDIQGLVPVIDRTRENPVSESEIATERREKSPYLKIDPPHTTTSPTYQPARPTVAQSATQWVDGSQTVDDPYEGDAGSGAPKRRLSKSQRKRLRKLKAEQRQR